MQNDRLNALVKSLKDYYTADPTREEALRNIIEHRAGFSLREIDWFVTNMAARKSQVFRNPKTGRIIDVGSDYKDTLRCYHKAAFDSFKRKSASSNAQADVKQRNFFRWALETGVVDHVAENIDVIKEDMARQKKTVRSVTNKKKRVGSPITAACSSFTIVMEPHEIIRPAPAAHVNIEW